MQYRRDDTLQSNTNIQSIKHDPLSHKTSYNSIAVKTKRHSHFVAPQAQNVEERVARPNQVTSFQIWELSFFKPPHKHGPCREHGHGARGRVVPCIAAYSIPTSLRPQLTSHNYQAALLFLFAIAFFSLTFIIINCISHTPLDPSFDSIFKRKFLPFENRRSSPRPTFLPRPSPANTHPGPPIYRET
jgi:hypothetical protein